MPPAKVSLLASIAKQSCQKNDDTLKVILEEDFANDPKTL